MNKNIIESSGLCLIKPLKENEISDIIKSIFSDKGVNIVEMFIARNFIAKHIHLLSQEQKNNFNEGLKFLYKENVFNDENDEYFSKYFFKLKHEPNDTKINILIDGDPIKLKANKKRIPQEFEIKSDFRKVNVEKSKLFKKYKNKDISQKFSTFNDIEKIEVIELINDIKNQEIRNHVVSLMLKKNNKSSVFEDFRNEFSKVKLLDLISINKELLKDNIEPQIYFSWKKEILYKLTGLIHELNPDEIFKKMVNKKGIYFSKTDLREMFETDNVFKEIILSLENDLPQININDRVKQTYPFLTSNKKIDLIVDILFHCKKNMVLIDKDNNKQAIFHKIDKTKNSNYSFDFVWKRRFVSNLLSDLYSIEIFNENEIKIWEKLIDKDNMLFKTNFTLEIQNLEQYEEFINIFVDKLKEQKGMNFNSLKNSILDFINKSISLVSFYKNVSLNDFENYLEKIYDSKENDVLLKVILTHMIFEKHFGFRKFLTSLKEYPMIGNIKNDIETYMDISNNENLNIERLEYISEYLNLGKLTNLINEKNSLLATDYLKDILDLNYRNQICLGQSHEGSANQINSFFKKLENDKKIELLEYILPKSKKIINSILIHNPQELLFVNSITPFENIHINDKNIKYIDFVMENIEIDKNYKEIIKNISIEKALSQGFLWKILENNNQAISDISYILNKKMALYLGNVKKYKEEINFVYNFLNISEELDIKEKYLNYGDENLGEITKFFVDTLNKYDINSKSLYKIKTSLNTLNQARNLSYLLKKSNSESVSFFIKQVQEARLLSLLDEKDEDVNRIKKKI